MSIGLISLIDRHEIISVVGAHGAIRRTSRPERCVSGTGPAVFDVLRVNARKDEG